MRTYVIRRLLLLPVTVILLSIFAFGLGPVHLRAEMWQSIAGGGGGPEGSDGTDRRTV